jgi:subtilase family serine protease
MTGPWTFSASIPTQTSYIFQSPEQQPLAFGDSIDYTMGFDQAMVGANQKILIIVNPDNKVIESTEKNNSASTTITILGN